MPGSTEIGSLYRTSNLSRYLQYATATTALSWWNHVSAQVNGDVITILRVDPPRLDRGQLWKRVPGSIETIGIARSSGRTVNIRFVHAACFWDLCDQAKQGSSLVLVLRRVENILRHV